MTAKDGNESNPYNSATLFIYDQILAASMVCAMIGLLIINELLMEFHCTGTHTVHTLMLQ